MQSAADIVFWAATAILWGIYAGAPLVIALWAWIRPRPVRKADITPRVTVIVAAYNEEHGIAAKLENTLALDYPRAALDVVMASDGSSDRTEEIARRYADRGVRVLPLPRRGKMHALDAAVQAAAGDILVFTDANTILAVDAVRQLVRPFADPEVGGVCGNQSHLKRLHEDTSAAGESLYWSYDKALKVLESRTGSIVSADGALYAIRRDLYRRPPSAAMTDDFAISTAVVEQGARLVFEPQARAYESAVGDAGGEFQRKVRIVTRGWRGVAARRGLLDPRRSGFYAFVLGSHKVMRRLAPVVLLILLGASLWPPQTSAIRAAAAAGQGAFYGAAVLGALLRRTSIGRHRALMAPFFFCLANGAALVALARVCAGRRVEIWQPRRAAPGTAPQ